MKLKLLFYALFFSNFLLAQEETTIKEYGLDALFFNRFLPLDNQIGTVSPYLFNYRKSTGDRFIRRNFDIDFSGVVNKSDNEPNRNSIDLDIDMLFGWGKRRNVYKDFYLYIGADVLIEPEYTSTDTEEERNLNGVLTRFDSQRRVYGLSSGIGPSLGVQYQITDRIGIFTEAAFYFNVFYSNEKFESKENPFADFKKQSFGFNKRFTLPGNLVLFYSFK